MNIGSIFGNVKKNSNGRRIHASNLVSVFNFFQVFVWSFLAILILPSRSHFLYDEAYFYDQAMLVAQHHSFPVFGPFISGSHPTAFTPGGGLWYLLSVPFFVSSNPLLGTVWMILFSVVGILILDRTFKKVQIEASLRFFSVFFLTWSAWHTWLVDRIWNVHIYWGLSLILLSIAVQIMSRPKDIPVPGWIFFALGILSALAVQVHLGGALAVLILFLWIGKYARHRITLHTSAMVLAGIFLMYVPYFYHELTTGFQNTCAMRSAEKFHGSNRQAIVRSFFAPWIYISSFKDPYALMTAFKEGWLNRFAFFSFLFSAGIGFLGLKQKHPFRFLILASWVTAPFYFLLNQRPFMDHYIASLIPYYLLALALGASYLVKQGMRGKILLIVGCSLFLSVSSLKSLAEYISHPQHPTLQDQIELAETIVAAQGVVTAQSGELDALIPWVLAKNLFHEEIRVQTPLWSTPCSVTYGYPAQDPAFILGPNSYYLCR